MQATSLERKLAGRIKALRIKRGLTQEELSELTGIGYKRIQALEGSAIPNVTLRTLERLATALGVEVKELFGG